MELTPRLRAIAEQVPRGAKLADIGTDHGYLPVWLILNGVIDTAIASDLREGPLDRARQTAARCGTAERISFRLCGGLDGIARSETDLIAIAGMGGDTIAQILAAAPWTRDKTLLLQPMTALPALRRWLGQNGYCIRAERIAREGQRLYSIWTVEGGEMPALSAGELWAGRQSTDPLRGEYLDFIARKVSRALTGHMAAAEPDGAVIMELQAVLTDLLRMKGELERGDLA